MVDSAGKTFQPEVQQCIDDCRRTHDVLLTASGHALRHGGGENTAHVIRVMSDAIEMCQTVANFLLRGSPNRGKVCGVNGQICREVARECGTFEDDVMKKVVSVATACAESCERLAD